MVGKKTSTNIATDDIGNHHSCISYVTLKPTKPLQLHTEPLFV